MSLLEYDPIANVWKNLFNYDSALEITAIAATNGKIFSIAKDAMKRQWTLTYDIQSGAVSQKSPPLLGTRSNNMVVEDGKFFILGAAPNGSAEFTPIRALQSYDPASEP